MEFRCKLCNRLTSKYEYEEIGLCKNCLNDVPEYREAKNKARIRVIRNFFASNEPIVKNNDDGTPQFICNLPKMGVVAGQTDEDFSVRISMKGDIFQREGNLVGLAGFLFDTNFYWATTPEKMEKAWCWFNQAIGWTYDFLFDFWFGIYLDTIRDFLDSNWNPVENEVKDTLFADILSLIWYLYNLDCLHVDTASKISEIKMHSKGRVRNFENLSKKPEFEHNFRFSRKASKQITDIRESLSHLAYESELALLAKHYGFNVELRINPDIIINGKSVEVKKPIERYIVSPARELTFVIRESAEIENLSNVVTDGFRQKADIVAINVNHLDERQIKGYKTDWQNQEKLINALTRALGYTTKDIVLLFKLTNNGYQGRIIRCKKKHS